jgi:hypothetical protein
MTISKNLFIHAAASSIVVYDMAISTFGDLNMIHRSKFWGLACLKKIYSKYRHFMTIRGQMTIGKADLHIKTTFYSISDGKKPMD